MSFLNKNQIHEMFLKRTRKKSWALDELFMSMAHSLSIKQSWIAHKIFHEQIMILLSVYRSWNILEIFMFWSVIFHIGWICMI